LNQQIYSEYLTHLQFKETQLKDKEQELKSFSRTLDDREQNILDL
jgi:hypothetical protein